MPDAPAHEPIAAAEIARAGRFGAFATPRVLAARERLEARAGAALEVFTDAARAMMAAALHQRLERLARVVLEFEFSVWRGQEQMTRLFFGSAPTTEAALEEETDATATARFVARVLEDGGAEFTRKYPELDRILAHVADCWVAANTELATRLAADRAELERVFGARFDRVVEVECGLSDPHHGSRFVTILAFASGARLVYKPRPLAVEAAFNTLVAWLNRRDPTLPLRVVNVLTRADHGWMEHIEAQPCADEAEARAYFQRAGRLLCLLHVLGAADLHSENVIAAGAQPVPIDLEVLLRPALAGAMPGARAWQQIAWEFEESVLSTGLLPAWLPVPGGGVVNLAGLGGERGGQSKGRKNRPQLGGREVAIERHGEDLVAGFSAMHALLHEERARLLAADGPLEAFRATTIRYVHRPTSVYVRALQASLGLKELESTAARREAFVRLERAADRAPAEEARALKLIAAAEIGAMLRLDVPYFRLAADGCELALENGTVVRGYFRESGFARCRRRLNGLSLADRERQCALIRGTLQTNRLRQHARRAPGSLGASVEATEPASAAALLDAAGAIARDLRESAIHTADAVTWLGPQSMPQSDRFNFAPLGHGLYDGALGVAFFLAAWSHVTGDREAAALTRKAVRPILQGLEGAEWKTRLQRAGGGLAAGWGGTIYGLARCARWLDDDAMRTAVRGLVAQAAEFETEASATAHDVMFGTAGAVLGLLAWQADTRATDALEAAIRAGEKLVRARRPAPDGAQVWRGETGFPTGFSHGAAGCAAALARLSRCSGETQFGRAALEALEFERRQQEMPEGRPQFESWCHGRPGLVLAEIEARGLRGAHDDARNLERMLAATAALPRGAIDQCCCGAAGHIDILHVAAQRLDRPELRAHALAAAGNLLANANARGAFGCIGDDGGVFSPGLFQGVAGIGYTLLRLARPEALPSFLDVA